MIKNRYKKIAFTFLLFSCSAQAVGWRDYFGMHGWQRITGQTKVLAALTALTALGLFEWQTAYLRQRFGLCAPQSTTQPTPLAKQTTVLTPQSINSAQPAGASSVQKSMIDLSQFSPTAKYFLGAYVPDNQTNELLLLRDSINKNIFTKKIPPLHITIRFIGTFDPNDQKSSAIAGRNEDPHQLYKNMLENLRQGIIEDENIKTINITFDKLALLGNNVVVEATNVPESLKNIRTNIDAKLQYLNIAQKNIRSLRPHISLGIIAQNVSPATAKNIIEQKAIAPITITFDLVQIGGGNTKPINLPLQIKHQESNPK